MGVVRGRQNPLHQAFSRRLRQIRKQRGLTLAEVAERAGLAGNSVVLYLESGDRAPRIDTVEKLAHALNLSPAFLAFGFDGEESKRGKALAADGVGSRLSAARSAQGLTMRALGRSSKTSDTTVRLTETGATVPSISKLEQLAKALGLSPSWLAYEVGPQVLPSRRGSRAAQAAAGC